MLYKSYASQVPRKERTLTLKDLLRIARSQEPDFPDENDGVKRGC